MDNPVESVRAFDKNCIGCNRHKKDIMISFKIEGDPEFHDIFLTQEQAEKLNRQLEEMIERNKA